MLEIGALIALLDATAVEERNNAGRRETTV
jgi:hypothetical protein